MTRPAFVLLIALVLSACDFSDFYKDADAQFGDQHCKTAISLIELHKIRFGAYPETLKDLQFTGEWDAIALPGVEYRRLDTGYELNLVRGTMGKPKASYPSEFWKGLGLVKSNMKG
jgi:hypothetical protein